MSCLDVMFHQSYGGHYLPASSAAAAYKAAYYHHQHQQQKKLGVYSRMQQDSTEQQFPGGDSNSSVGVEGEAGWGEGGPTGPGGFWAGGTWRSGKDSQPAEAEYLSSRCVLFTYFHGNIEDVVDEHFSRALSQPSTFTGETRSSRCTPIHTSASAGLWKDSVSLSEGQCNSLSSSLWGGGYQSQTSPCLPIHPDFSPIPAGFHAPDRALWTGHALPQPSLPPPTSIPDPWAYSLSPQTSASCTHVHDVYPPTHPHTHMHPRHTHTVLHPHPSHDPCLNPRFSPLLLTGVKTQSPLAHSPAGHSTHSNTHSSQSPGIHSGVKTEVEQASPPTLTPSAWPTALHTPMDIYDSGLDQDKVKAVWF